MNKCECKNCVHEEVCNGNVSIDYFTSKCDHYKDKSLIVELPCKVGDKLYWLSLHRDMVEAHLKETGFVAKLENGFEYIIPFDVIGKTVFLTKEDAERKLQEIEGK